jgi:hypothetical protein
MHHRLEKASLVLIRRRKIHREEKVCAGEAAMQVAMAHRSVAPLIGVDEWFHEERVRIKSVGTHFLRPLGRRKRARLFAAL